MSSNGNLLQAGYLVVGNITHRGCASYRQEGKTERKVGDDGLETEYTAQKHVRSKTEQQRVGQVRSGLARKLVGLGTHIAHFGYLVPRESKEELEATIKEIRDGCIDYNQSAKYTSLHAHFTVFEVDGTDERVASALYDRVVDLLGQCLKHIEAGDVKSLRGTLSQMTGLEKVLPAKAGSAISKVIEDARKQAKEAIRSAKETEAKVEELAKPMLEAVEIDGIRAQFIEAARRVDEAAQSKSILPEAIVRNTE